MDESAAKAYRIGDRERDEAVRQLREHHADGRLDIAEFDERMTAALAARTSNQLADLFTDLPPLDSDPQAWLPAPLAGRPAEQPQRSSNAWNWRQGVSGAAFPLALIVCFATGWRYWWIMLVPMMVSAALLGDDDEDEDVDKDGETPAKTRKELDGGS